MSDNLSNKKCKCEEEAAKDALSYNDYLIQFGIKKQKCKECPLFIVVDNNFKDKWND